MRTFEVDDKKRSNFESFEVNFFFDVISHVSICSHFEKVASREHEELEHVFANMWIITTAERKREGERGGGVSAGY